jgi:hypothetical protein
MLSKKVNQYSTQTMDGKTLTMLTFELGKWNGRAYHHCPSFSVLFLNCEKVVYPLKSGYLLDSFPRLPIL